MKRIQITFYPSAETDQMIKLLAGIKGVRYNTIVVQAVEKFLEEALKNGHFEDASNVVKAFKRNAA